MNVKDSIDKLRSSFNAFEPTVYLFPTMKCNLNCKMCYAGAALYNSFENELSDYEYCLLIENLIDLGFKRFDISGGEPLLRHELIYTISQKIKDKGAKLRLITNGTLLNSSFLNNKFRPELFEFIAVSLDSADKETYNNIRGGYVFETVISGIKGLVDDGYNVGLNAVCLNENKNQFDQLFLLAENLGVSFVHLLRNRQVSPLVDSSKSSLKINWMDLYEQLQLSLSSVSDNLFVVVTLPQYIHNDYIKKLRSCFRERNNILILSDCVGGCGAFNQNIAITSVGEVTGCVTMINDSNFWIGNVTKNTLTEILSNADKWIIELSKRSNGFSMNTICKNCLSYRFCKGGCPLVAQKYRFSWHECDPSCNTAYEFYQNIGI